MKSPKNLLKRLHGGVKLTEVEYDYLLSTYSEFRVGDTIVYNGGIKFTKHSKKFIRKYLGNQEPIVEKLNVGQTYLITDITISPSLNKDNSLDFDNPNIILKLKGFEKRFTQDFFSIADPSNNYEPIIKESKAESKDSKEYLIKMMNKCVKIEDYEKAAFYRDELKKLG